MSNSRVTDRLIKAAVQVFAEKGFAGTATRDIARLAEVNETSLFRIFGSKEDLFWAALSSRLQEVRLRKELQQALAEDAHPRVVLPLFIEFVVNTAAYQPELIRLLGVALLELRPQAEIVQRQALAPIFRTLVDYLSRGVTKGTLRPLDPSITAVGLAATIIGQQGLASVLTGMSALHANTEEAVLAYSEYWLKTLLPADATELVAARPFVAGTI